MIHRFHWSGYGRQIPFVPERAAQPDSFYEKFYLNGTVVFVVCAILAAIFLVAYFWEPIKKWSKK